LRPVGPIWMWVSSCGWTHHHKPANKYETAKCKDAALSYSRHSQGTCSHHHGVRYWFK
jgi:hypothetical protein